MIKSNLAEKKALEALHWISRNESHLTNFLEENGASVSDIFGRAKEPEFLLFVLEYCLSTDEIAIECARELSIDPNQLAEIRSALPGGEIYNWI
tara:strand:- start:43 stop:324 length:282 start_codon:yes stop_codon:yes gene_type:complete